MSDIDNRLYVAFRPRNVFLPNVNVSCHRGHVFVIRLKEVKILGQLIFLLFLITTSNLIAARCFAYLLFYLKGYESFQPVTLRVYTIQIAPQN